MYWSGPADFFGGGRFSRRCRVCRRRARPPRSRRPGRRASCPTASRRRGWSLCGGRCLLAKRAQAVELVQRRGGAGGDAAAIRATAARGVQGSGSPLPHLGAIQASFGRHDVSSIQAHVGGDAAAATGALGAEAYATGNSGAFKRSPDLHTAAHEAAHIVQQRRAIDGGLGRRRSAAHLLVERVQRAPWLVGLGPGR